jgi:hypothetical protein
MRFVGAVALALVMLWVPIDGVAQYRNPLKGLTTMKAMRFNPHLIVSRRS